MINAVKAVKYIPYTAAEPVRFFITNRRHISNPEKYSCFVRRIGVEKDESGWSDFITCIDKELMNAKLPYLRSSVLAEAVTPSQAQHYGKLYEDYLRDGSINLDYKSTALKRTLAPALTASLKELKVGKGLSEDTVRRNFAIKLLYFADVKLRPLFSVSDYYPKIVFVGNIRQQEYLFLYFCALMGCDVLYINSEQDVDFSKELSVLHKLPLRCRCSIPPVYSPESVRAEIKPMVKPPQPARTEPAAVRQPQSAPPVIMSASMVHLQRAQTAAPAPQTPVRSAPVPPPVTSFSQSGSGELTYEQLAAMSESVVMITLFNTLGKIVGSGSGVVISQSGYILTNLHVAAYGSRYLIRFENDSREYEASGIIKYNKDRDLAIIRVERACVPLKPYLDNKLARGQRVVAIGSPLGLFNTVSDGIISAFRTQENGTHMIQFTAPISSGSSGGAVLDMYGRLIGISTSGFDEAQNINLAVDINEAYSFAGNLFK